MNKDDLIKKFSEVKTSFEMKKLIVNLFEELEIEKSRKGINDFKRRLESNIPNIEQWIVKHTQQTGNGIVEILEDHLNL